MTINSQKPATKGNTVNRSGRLSKKQRDNLEKYKARGRLFAKNREARKKYYEQISD